MCLITLLREAGRPLCASLLSLGRLGSLCAEVLLFLREAREPLRRGASLLRVRLGNEAQRGVLLLRVRLGNEAQRGSPFLRVRLGNEAQRGVSFP